MRRRVDCRRVCRRSRHDSARTVASASRRLIIIADESKLSPRLSGHVAVPVEVVEFGWAATQARLTARGCVAEPRCDDFGDPYRTDNGNRIFNCHFQDLSDPAAVERALSMTVGVVETGLFIGLATTVLVAAAGGVRRIDKEKSRFPQS